MLVTTIQYVTFFCEEAKIRAQDYYFLIILLRSVNPPLLAIDAAAFLGQPFAQPRAVLLPVLPGFSCPREDRRLRRVRSEHLSEALRIPPECYRRNEPAPRHPSICTLSPRPRWRPREAIIVKQLSEFSYAWSEYATNFAL